MVTRDFHGWTLDDAIQEVELIVGQVRKEQKAEFTTFITGRGKIRDEILNLLIKYNLDAEFRWGNDGVITVTIE